MDNKINFSVLINAIWKRDDKVIDEIYKFIINNDIKDRDVIIKIMKYMYEKMNITEYFNLLKLFAKSAKNDSEIIYFLSFYFLMKKSPYHSLICFQMVKREESPFYYFSSKQNIKYLERKDSKIAVMIKKNKQAKGQWESDSFKKQMENLAFIENEARKTVNEMIKYIKRNTED